MLPTASTILFEHTMNETLYMQSRFYCSYILLNYEEYRLDQMTWVPTTHLPFVSLVLL